MEVIEEIFIINGRSLFIGEKQNLSREEEWTEKENNLVYARINKETLSKFKEGSFEKLLDLEKSKIKRGDYVLDYGCGPGSYSFVAAKVVGKEGRIFAADIHPLAIEKVKKKANRKNIENITTIQTDCDTKLPDNSIDVVICFDVMHDIADKNNILKEFHRVLKPDGYLSFDDHHYSNEEIIEIFSKHGLFKLNEQQDKIYNFRINRINLSE